MEKLKWRQHFCMISFFGVKNTSIEIILQQDLIIIDRIWFIARFEGRDEDKIFCRVLKNHKSKSTNEICTRAKWQKMSAFQSIQRKVDVQVPTYYSSKHIIPCATFGLFLLLTFPTKHNQRLASRPFSLGFSAWIADSHLLISFLDKPN